jgi:hypothetical protein
VSQLDRILKLTWPLMFVPLWIATLNLTPVAMPMLPPAAGYPMTYKIYAIPPSARHFQLPERIISGAGGTWQRAVPSTCPWQPEDFGTHDLYDLDSQESEN